MRLGVCGVVAFGDTEKPIQRVLRRARGNIAVFVPPEACANLRNADAVGVLVGGKRGRGPALFETASGSLGLAVVAPAAVGASY